MNLSSLILYDTSLRLSYTLLIIVFHYLILDQEYLILSQPLRWYSFNQRDLILLYLDFTSTLLYYMRITIRNISIITSQLLQLLYILLELDLTQNRLYYPSYLLIPNQDLSSMLQHLIPINKQLGILPGNNSFTYLSIPSSETFPQLHAEDQQPQEQDRNRN